MLQFRSLNFVPTFGIFNIPLLGNATIDKTDNFECKTSIGFCYKYLPLVGHVRKLDDSTVIGKLKMCSYTLIYFTLKVPAFPQ